MTALFKELAEQWLTEAGITLNGNGPTDLTVYDDRFFERIFHAALHRKANLAVSGLLLGLKSSLLNPQTIRRAAKVGRRHYDIGNDLFRRMFDREMNYSCGYWKRAGNLDQAQEHKLDLICRTLLPAGRPA